MKASLSNLAAVLAAQRQISRPTSARKKSSNARSDSSTDYPAAAAAPQK